MTIIRCGWCSNDPIYMAYHDQEWGRPLRNEAQLFELLCLEGQQAGLAWITVLKKREAYRRHFFRRSIAEIAKISDAELAEIALDAGIIRHKGKLAAIRSNALAWQQLKQQQIDPVKWLWSFTEAVPPNHDIPDYKTAPAQTEASLRMSKSLKKNGFKFVGPTICYAFMQSSGMVNDHENSCSFKNDMAIEH